MMMALDGGGEHNFYTATPIILDYSANKSSPTMGRHPANVSRRRWDGRTDERNRQIRDSERTTRWT